jgi:hypothetical protein
MRTGQSDADVAATLGANELAGNSHGVGAVERRAATVGRVIEPEVGWNGVNEYSDIRRGSWDHTCAIERVGGSNEQRSGDSSKEGLGGKHDWKDSAAGSELARDAELSQLLY